MSEPKTVRIRDWMSIKSAEFEIRPLTVFYGANGSGKTAISLALWAARKDSAILNKALKYKLGDPKYVLRCVGLCLTEVEVVGFGKSKFDSNGEELEVVREGKWPWQSAAYLGEERIYLFRRALRGHEKSWQRLSDFGVIPKSEFSLDVGDLKATVEALPSRFYVVKNGKEIKAELAPSSDLEFLLLYKALESARNGLVVIDDVDLHLSGIRLARYIELVVRATDSATFVLTTSSSDVLTILAKLVEDKKLSVDKLALYHLKYENHETKVEPIRVYEDGTLEKLPEVELFIKYIT